MPTCPVYVEEEEGDGTSPTVHFRYRVGHSGDGTSQTNTTSRPTHLDLWNLRASMSRVYEDTTDDVNVVKALLRLNEEFLQQASLGRAS